MLDPSPQQEVRLGVKVTQRRQWVPAGSSDQRGKQVIRGALLSSKPDWSNFRVRGVLRDCSEEIARQGAEIALLLAVWARFASELTRRLDAAANSDGETTLAALDEVATISRTWPDPSGSVTRCTTMSTQPATVSTTNRLSMFSPANSR